MPSKSVATAANACVCARAALFASCVSLAMPRISNASSARFALGRYCGVIEQCAPALVPDGLRGLSAESATSGSPNGAYLYGDFSIADLFRFTIGRLVTSFMDFWKYSAGMKSFPTVNVI